MGESSLFLILSVFVPPPPLVWGTCQVTTQTPISGNRTPSPLLPEIGSLEHSQLLISHSTYSDLPSSFSCARCAFSFSFSFPPRATFHFRSDDFMPVILRCPLSGSPCLRPPVEPISRLAAGVLVANVMVDAPDHSSSDDWSKPARVSASLL